MIAADGTGTVAREKLKAYVERIERLEEERKSLGADIRDVYAEAKANGFDTKVMRQVIRLRAQDTMERQEQEALLDIYKHALGMLPLEVVAEEASEPKPTGAGVTLEAGDARMDVGGRAPEPA